MAGMVMLKVKGVFCGVMGLVSSSIIQTGLP